MGQQQRKIDKFKCFPKIYDFVTFIIFLIFHVLTKPYKHWTLISGNSRNEPCYQSLNLYFMCSNLNAAPKYDIDEF